jgi:hypothetical protein
MDLGEIGWDDMDCIDLVQNRYQWRAHVEAVINIRIPQSVGYILSNFTTDCFARRAQLRGIS